MNYMDPVEIVRRKKKQKALYEAWVDFKCRANLVRYSRFKQAFAEARKSHGITGRTFFIPQILVDKTPAAGRRNTFWDYRKLAKYATQISPMIYTYAGIKDSARVGDLIAMYNGEIGKDMIAPTLLAGYCGEGEVAVDQKRMIYYQLLESLIHKAPGILYWNSSGTMDPLNLAQISEGIRVARSYEQVFIEGKPFKDLRIEPDWVRVKALHLNKTVLVYVANYDRDASANAKIIFDNSTLIKVIDASSGKSLNISEQGFTTDFKTDRGKLFVATLVVN